MQEHVYTLLQSYVDLTAETQQAWFRGTIKSFNLPEHVDRSATEEQLIRLLDNFTDLIENDHLEGKRAITGLLDESDFASLLISKCVDKTQARAKPGPRVLEHEDEPIEEVHPALRPRYSNQPVQSVLASVAMYLAGITRMIAASLSAPHLDSHHISSQPKTY